MDDLLVIDAFFSFLFPRPVRISWLLCTRRGVLHSSDRARFVGGRGIFSLALVENWPPADASTAELGSRAVLRFVMRLYYVYIILIRITIGWYKY